MPSLIRYLTAEEFVREMKSQDLSGKHALLLKDAAQLQQREIVWRKIAEFAQQNISDPTHPPFVLVEGLPVSWLQLEHQPEYTYLVEAYTARSSRFPPIYVSLTNFQLEKDPEARVRVKNGNHRVTAAKYRGDDVIDAIMSQETWDNIKKKYSGYCRCN